MSGLSDTDRERRARAGRVGLCVLAVGMITAAIWAFVSTAAGLVAAGAGFVIVLLTARNGSRERLDSEAEVSEDPIEVPHELPSVPPSLEPEVVLRSLLESGASEGRPAAAHLWLEDPSSATLRLVQSVGPMSPAPDPVSMDDPTLGAAIRESQAVLSELARVRTMDQERLVWRFALPLVAGEYEGVAALDIESPARPDGERLAGRTAGLRGALSGVLAVHISRTEMELAQSLVDIARDLSRALDPQEVLEKTLDRAMRLCDAATASVMLVDEENGRLVIRASRGLPREVVKDTSIAPGEGIAGWVLATGQPLLIEDLPGKSQGGRRHGVRSAVSVPLGDDDGILGVVNVGSRTFPARFTDSHLRALETLGKQSVVALRNALAVNTSRDLYFDTLKTLSLALETKDPYASGGTQRVIELTTAIGRAYGLDESEQEALRIAGLLHDIGMGLVGEGVLSESRPLSTVEHALLKMHPQVAMEILEEAPALRHVAPIVYHHHEWFDGHGYLGGLAGEDIPLGARILAVADAYVAMTSDRPYRHAMQRSEAIAELREKAGTQFDPAVVDVLVEILGGRRNQVPDERRS